MLASVTASRASGNIYCQMGNEERTEDRVRRRLLDLRTERGLTLAAVADAAGMAPSTLSRLEQGRRRLALDHLPALARALGTTADDLLAAPPAQDPRVRPVPHSHDGMTVWPLNRAEGDSGLRAFKIRYAAGGRTPAPRTHAGHDWTYVLSGRLRLVLGDGEFVLHPGETAEFDCRTPHWLGAVDEAVEVIAIFGAPGERAHARG
jgi:transcriptional regulator with XRE-family HTH domain